MLQLVTAKSLFVKKTVLYSLTKTFHLFFQWFVSHYRLSFGPEYLLIWDMKVLGFYITFKLIISLKDIECKIKHFKTLRLCMCAFTRAF